MDSYSFDMLNELFLSRLQLRLNVKTSAVLRLFVGYGLTGTRIPQNENFDHQWHSDVVTVEREQKRN